MTRNRPYLGNGLLAAAIIFLALAAVLVVGCVVLLGCGRAQAQAPTFNPVTGFTDCGIDGTLVALNTTVQYDPLHPETERARWGPCSGSHAPGCDDNVRNAWGENRCITTESESAVVKEALRWEISGTCSPPAGTPYPSQQLVEDYGKVVGAFGGRNGLRARWERACFVRPTPAPLPSPTVAPSVEPPTPRVEPTPVATTCPTCPPPVECEVCPTFERAEEPAEVRATIEAGLNALGRRWRAKVAAAKAWRREHPGPWYVPNVLSNGLGITSTLEPCDYLGDECWRCDALTGPVCEEAAP